MSEPLSNEYLEGVRKRCENSSNGLWISSIEGRDHPLGGDNVILRGVKNISNIRVREEDDLYLVGGTVADYDFVANAKQDIPALLDEIDRLKELIITIQEK
jgi:hypothetical protein